MTTLTISDKEKFLLKLEGQDFSFEPKDFIKVREAASKRLKVLDFPTKKDEDWKYTHVRTVSNGDFKPQSSVNLSFDQIKKFFIPNLDAYTLVFINGFFAPKFSSYKHDLGQDFIVSNLNEAKTEHTKLFESQYAFVAKDENAFFLNLNNAFSQDGAFVYVGKNLVVDKPIHVLHISSGEGVCSMPRNFILAEKNSEVKLINSFHSMDEEESFTNVVTEAVVNDGANVYIDKIQAENNTGSNLISYEQATVGKDANFRINTIPLSGGLIRNNLNIKLTGTGSNADLYAPIVLNGNSHVDNQTFVEHIKPNCTSNELYKCVVNDHAHNVFNGKILVYKEAQKTNAFQSNANVLLSEDAKVNAKPQLEIYADDVKCSHGCTIGQFDDEALFYLRSRGMKRSTAQKVLLEAFVGEILANIEIEAVKDFIAPIIQNNYNSIEE